MYRRLLVLGMFGLLITVASSGCLQTRSIVGPDLMPIKRLNNPDQQGFCDRDKQGRLVISIKNQGSGKAPATTSTIEFFPGGLFPLSTPPVAAGGTVTLPPLKIPTTCFDPDCGFRIIADSGDQLYEFNEINNIADGNCAR